MFITTSCHMLPFQATDSLGFPMVIDLTSIPANLLLPFDLLPSFMAKSLTLYDSRF
jgi:hypothetical protein